MGATAYGFGVDMWAMGCILGEMIKGKPLFPGSTTINQLERIVEVVGKGDESISEVSPFANSLVETVDSHVRRTSTSAEQIAGLFVDCADTNPAALSLISTCCDCSARPIGPAILDPESCTKERR